MRFGVLPPCKSFESTCRGIELREASLAHDVEHRNAHQQFGGASREQHMLRLTVHQNRWRRSAERSKNTLQFVDVAVA